MRGFLAKLCKKNGIAKRIVSMSLALLMVLSTLQALPAGILVANAAETAQKIHVTVPETWGWGTPSVNVQGSDGTTKVTSDGTTTMASVEIEGWGGQVGYELLEEAALKDGCKSYYFYLEGTFTGLQFIDLGGGNAVVDNRGVWTGNVAHPNLTITDAEEMYFLCGNNNKWYSDAAMTQEIAAPAGSINEFDVVIHYNNPNSWSKVNVHAWTSSDLTSWPGIAATANSNTGWYDAVFENVSGNVINFKFNDDTNESNNFSHTATAELVELWVTGDSVSTTVPAGWTNNYSATVHWQNTPGWETVYAHRWNPGGLGDMPRWPGVAATASQDKDGWYDTTLSGMTTNKMGVLFHNNDEQQTANIEYTLLSQNTELWVTGTKDAPVIHTTAPDAWKNPSGGGSTAITGEVKLHFKNESDWAVVNTWAWDDSKNYTGGAWPGEACSANAENTGWYDIIIDDLNLVDGVLKFKFNNVDGSNNAETANMSVTLTEETTDVWITGGAAATDSNVSTTAPDGWVAGSTGKNLTINYYNSKDYEEVAAYLFDTNGNVVNGWPGKQATKEIADNAEDKWYTVTIENIPVNALTIIMNNNNNQQQDENIPLTLSKTNTEIWIKDGAILTSPIVNGTTVTFNYVDESRSLSDVYLRGTVTDWDPGVAFETKNGNVFTHTMTVNPGKYTYKFWHAADVWKADPFNNANLDGDGNSILVVPGLYAGSPIEAQKGVDFVLPATLDYIDANGQSTTKPVTYALKNAENSSFATITDGTTLKATAGCAETAVDLVATTTDGSNETATVTVTLVDKIYTYTVYAYSPIADRVNVNNSALYIWDKAGETSLAAGDHAFTTTETLADGKTWLKAEIQLSCAQAIGFIFKCKGSWDWQTADLIFSNQDKTDKTIYLYDGYDKVYTSLDELPTISQLCIEYTRSDNNYKTPYVEVWGNGYSYKEEGSTKNFTYNFDNSTGKYIVNVPVALGAKDKTVGFNVYNNGAIDGEAQSVTIKAGEKLTKVKYNNGVLTIVPDSSSYVADRNNNKISFYYRDEAKFLANQMHTISSVKLAIRKAVGDAAVSAEELIDMTYDANDERFELENQELPSNSDVYYYFVVDENTVLDVKNDRRATIDSKEYCMVRNRVYDVNLAASVKYSDMTYEDGNVLYLTYTNVDGFNPEKITVDLSSLGLGSKVEMDKELMALNFGCLEGTSVGPKAVKVTLIDDCDMVYTATATVNVKARTKTANTSTKLGTFDWDEAVIYFAITDRFFDGNSANNTGDPNSTADDAAFNKADPGSYHGGDFAGLTQKINYLYELGVNTIWLTPIVDNVDINCDNGETDDSDYYAYHGYWASDFTKLNPHLGNEAEFKALVDAAHAKGMKIMVDVVLNHAGYGAEDTFTGLVRTADNTVPGDNVLDGLSGLPDFATEDPAVRAQLIEWQTGWMTAYGIDYYRVDTVKHVENTTWNAFKNALVEKNQDFKLIGEYYDAGYQNDFEQLDAGRMDSILDFNFNDLMARLVGEDLAGIESELGRRNTMLTNTATVGSFTSSHDEDGLLFTMRKSKGDWADSLMKVAATFQATAKGQPVIYYGEEIGLTGENNWPYYTNRPDFDWAELEAQKADTNSMFNHYKKVLNIRRNYSEVFAKGTRNTVVADSGNGYEIFSRSYKDKTLYVGVNVWGDAREATFFAPGAAGSVYTDLYSGKTYTVAADGSLTISIPGAQDGGTAILVGTGVAVKDTNEITVKIHYTRNDGNYTGWNLWAWSESGLGGASYKFVKEGNDMVATVSKIPGRSTTRLGYHTRLNEWDAQDYGSDQWVDLSDVVSGTVHYYINSSSYGGTRVLGSDAIVGTKIVKTEYNRNTNVVKVSMSAPITGSAAEAFKIKCTSTDSAIDIESVEKNGNQYFLTLKQDISSLEALLLSYTITYDGYTYNLMTPNLYSSEEFEDAYAYSGSDLGLTYTANASTFKLWAPTADSVTLNVYSGGTAGTADKLGSYTMTGGTKADKGVWTYVLNGDWNGKYYTYTVNVANKANELCDPYARTTGVNGKRAMILDLASTNPEGWDADKNAKRHDGMKQTDAVIYELHVRDLSIDSSSGVDSKYQGKFMGLTQTGTKTAGGNPTALDHMINLGITHLHLIPVYDYGSVDETKLSTPQFNWGYDPVNYNVPEGSYSTNPYDGSVRVAEMKQMIKTLHDNNINVVMDVVYNHVYDAETFSFNQAVPKYFSRTKEDGTYSSTSGCGNDTASERAMVHKYIVDSILYWHNEYHIDGFRFDLVGLIDTVTINKLVADVHAIDPDIIFYGEGWDMDSTALSKDNYYLAKQGNSSKTPGFAYFSDNIRNGIAGSNIDGNGYIWGKTGQDANVSALSLAKSSWTTNPSHTVNYVSCHDNYTLMDKINIVSNANVTSYNYTPGAYQVAQNNLAAAFYMFAEGIPLVHAGEDMLRIKLDETGEVIHNSYKSPDYVNKIRWSNLDTAIYKDTTDYYKGLIEFRKNHAVLRLPTADLVAANVTSTVHSSSVIVNTFKGNSNYSSEVSDGIVTIFNASDNAVTISNKYGITSGTEWKVCVNKENAGTDVLETITTGSVTVPAHSVMALVKGETVDTNSIYAQNNRVTLTLDKTTLTTGIGGVVAINATTNTPASLTWVSSDTNVATVDAQGRVTAVAAGSATITVSTYHGVEATCAVTVTNEAVEETITIDKTALSLVAGESDTLVITVSPAGTTATYASTDEAVATIDSTGKVTAVAAGTATVTATLADGTSVSCVVTVTAAPVEETVTLNKTTLSLTAGASETLTATVTPAGTTVSFSSKDTDVATVDANGKVTAVAEGTTEIVVATAAGKTAICEVTVTKAVVPTPTPTPTPNPVPSTPDSDATTGVGDGAQAGINPGTPTKPADEITPEDEDQVQVEVETKAETEVPENVTDVTPVVDEKLQNAIANETEKILEDILDDEISDDVMSEETIENVKKAQENGDGIITEVIVDKLDEADVDADVKEALAKALADSVKDKKGAETKIAQYLDLSVLLKTTSGQKLGTINKLSKNATFTIAVPEDLVKEGRVFVVLRMHEGETTVLETTLNSDGTLSFKTDRFSTYALAYIDAPAEDAKDDEVTEGDVPSGSTNTEEEGGNNFATFIIVGLIIVIIAALVIIFLAMKRKKD